MAFVGPIRPPLLGRPVPYRELVAGETYFVSRFDQPVERYHVREIRPRGANPDQVDIIGKAERDPYPGVLGGGYPGYEHAFRFYKMYGPEHERAMRSGFETVASQVAGTPVSGHRGNGPANLIHSFLRRKRRSVTKRNRRQRSKSSRRH